MICIEDIGEKSLHFYHPFDKSEKHLSTLTLHNGDKEMK